VLTHIKLVSGNQQSDDLDVLPFFFFLHPLQPPLSAQDQLQPPSALSSPTPMRKESARVPARKANATRADGFFLHLYVLVSFCVSSKIHEIHLVST